MIAKQIIFCGDIQILACDAVCTKAWGSNKRPRLQLSAHEDDYEYLADSELANAPQDPGTTEGPHGKPQTPEERLNKWCCRECERSVMVAPNEDFQLPDFSLRIRNIKQ